MTATKKHSTLFKELRDLVFIILIALFIRSFIIEPFYVPTGSLKPNLLEGEYVVSTKYSYGYSKYSLPWFIPLFNGRIFFSAPERGDVIIFWPPGGTDRYIKRLIGLPGDKIQIIDGIININDKPIAKNYIEEITLEDNVNYLKYSEILPNDVKYNIIEIKDPIKGKRYYNSKVYNVPKGHYFFMGDNRDNSIDSRVDLGYVPEENLISKARFIWLSMKKQLLLPTWNIFEQIPRILQIPSWLASIRFNRIFSNL
jgi:signal peptidase I